MDPNQQIDILFDPAFNPANLVHDEIRESLIRKLKQLAAEQSPDISLKDFCIATDVEFKLIARKFGRWSEFREAAGLPRHARRRGWGAYTNQQIIDALQDLAAEQGERITLAEFVRHTRISNTAIINHFGNFSELRRQAGLKPNRRGTKLHTDEQLFQHFHNVAQKLGRIPTGDEFNRLAPISMGTLYRRFGNKQQVEQRYAEFQQTQNPSL